MKKLYKLICSLALIFTLLPMNVMASEEPILQKAHATAYCQSGTMASGQQTRDGVCAGAKEKIILGIDPGTTIMGYGVLRVKGTKPEMIAMGIIDLRKFANHYLKLRHIHERVLSIIESYLPDDIVTGKQIGRAHV